MRALGIGELDDGVGFIGAIYAFGRYRYASCVSVDYIYKPVIRSGGRKVMLPWLKSC